MIARIAFTAALALIALPASANEPDEDDPYIWLEEIQGEEALAKVDEWNAATEAALMTTPEFPIAQAWAKQILDDDRQIAMPDAIMGDRVTNFWRDADNPRGLWRIASLDAYMAGAPDWRTLIDVDALGREEGESWVWHGANCLAPEYRRCLVSLSPGGTDADVLREFDMQTGEFVEDGFSLPTAKSRVTWFDEDTLLVATEEGEGSLTVAGYPRRLRLWERGTDVADARLLAEGVADDYLIAATSTLDGETRRRFIVQVLTTWTRQISLVGEDGSVTALPIPLDAEFEAVLDGHVIARLSSPLQARNRMAPAGSLVAWSLEDIESGETPRPIVVFAPSETQAVEEVSASDHTLWVKVLDDVSGKLIQVRPGEPGWFSREMNLPANSTIQIAGTGGETAFVTVESMLSPPTLYAVSPDDEAVAIASEPAQFNADQFTVEQKFATSKDGTQVPYYLVRPKGTEGPLPTLIHAYGGFMAAQTPKYLTAEPYRSGPLALFWVESGNAYVLANIRGGGEYGPRWHQEALRENRQNAFDDFHAVADDLVADGLTTPGNIAASGRSNGGVLVGAVANQRPGLYGAIISGSPLIDMKRYNKLLAGASWMGEYGNPDVAEDWAFMREWSPYQNMREGDDVPAAFYYLSTLDDRVHPGHARKAAARHEEYGQTFYYREFKEGGHSVGSDNEEDASRAALLLSYLNREIGDSRE